MAWVSGFAIFNGHSSIATTVWLLSVWSGSMHGTTTVVHCYKQLAHMFDSESTHTATPKHTTLCYRLHASNLVFQLWFLQSLGSTISQGPFSWSPLLVCNLPRIAHPLITWDSEVWLTSNPMNASFPQYLWEPTDSINCRGRPNNINLSLNVLSNQFRLRLSHTIAYSASYQHVQPCPKFSSIDWSMDWFWFNILSESWAVEDEKHK